MNIASFEDSWLHPLACEDHHEDDCVWSINRNESTLYIKDTARNAQRTQSATIKKNIRCILCREMNPL